MIFVVILGPSPESLGFWGVLCWWVVSRLQNSKPHLRKYNILHRSFLEGSPGLIAKMTCWWSGLRFHRCWICLLWFSKS
uniref:Uncharacterized protein n=1 Tax=Sus scrofa TaxID=9823 RepID=A0A4X1UTA4_PIG